MTIRYSKAIVFAALIGATLWLAGSGAGAARAKTPNPPASFAGKYSNREIFLRISSVGRRYKVNVVIGTSDCIGQVKGMASVVGQSLILDDRNPKTGKTACRVSFRHRGPNLVLMESGGDCFDIHGASCSFDGTVTPDHGPERAAQRRGVEPNTVSRNGDRPIERAGVR